MSELARFRFTVSPGDWVEMPSGVIVGFPGGSVHFWCERPANCDLSKPLIAILEIPYAQPQPTPVE